MARLPTAPGAPAAGATTRDAGPRLVTISPVVQRQRAGTPPVLDPRRLRSTVWRPTVEATGDRVPARVIVRPHDHPLTKKETTDMVIDAHAHPYWYGYDPAKLVENMDEHGIDVAWLLTWEVSEDTYSHSYDKTFMAPYTGIPIEAVWDAVAQYPDRFVAGYAPDPKGHHAIEKVKAAVAHGVRVSGEYKFRTLFDDPDAIRLYRVCGELGLPVTFHIDVPNLPPNDVTAPLEWWYGGTIHNVENALRLCPDTVFLGHAPGFWREVAGDADSDPAAYPKGPIAPGGRLRPLFDAYPNLHADLSAGSALTAISRDREWGRRFIVDYHDRLLFARDFFDDELMKYLQSLDLPAHVWDAVMSGNALRLVPPE